MQGTVKKSSAPRAKIKKIDIRTDRQTGQPDSQPVTDRMADSQTDREPFRDLRYFFYILPLAQTDRYLRTNETRAIYFSQG